MPYRQPLQPVNVLPAAQITIWMGGKPIHTSVMPWIEAKARVAALRLANPSRTFGIDASKLEVRA